MELFENDTERQTKNDKGIFSKKYLNQNELFVESSSFFSLAFYYIEIFNLWKSCRMYLKGFVRTKFVSIRLSSAEGLLRNFVHLV